MAEEENALTRGDILIVFSDSATDTDWKNLMSVVEYLTCQNYHVSYAPASQCIGNLEQYTNILCYNVERYPEELIEQLATREEKGNKVKKLREELENQEVGENISVLFVGNGMLQEYLNKTGRKYAYYLSDEQVAHMVYSFGNLTEQECLVRQEKFLFLNRDVESQNGILKVGEFEGYVCANSGVLYHIPAIDFSDDHVKASAFREITMWMQKQQKEDYSYAQYIVLNQVYPFQEPQKLWEMVEKLTALEQPYIISVMPIYVHGEYPAMQHFCEILRYAQAHEGMIFIHTPINQLAEFDIKQMQEALATAVSFYCQQGVYPLGLQVPGNWMNNRQTIQIMNGFSTILVSNEEDSRIAVDTSLTSNIVIEDNHQWIAPVIELNKEGTSYLTTYSSALYFDITDDKEDIEQKLQACMNSPVPLMNLWAADHSVRIGDNEFLYQNYDLKVNGELKQLAFEATEYQEKYEYHRNLLERVSADLTGQNSKLIVAVVLVSALFVVFLFIARHQNRKRFLYKRNLDQEYEEPEDIDEI